MKNMWLFCSLVIHMSALWWGLTALQFRSAGFDVSPPPQDPPNIKKSIFCHILGLNLKMSYQIASLFDMYIDMGERIAGNQDRPSLIIDHPLRAPQIAQNIHIFLIFWPIYENWEGICEPRWAQSDYNWSPPPQIAKDVNAFTYEKFNNPLFFLVIRICLQCDEVFMTL